MPSLSLKHARGAYASRLVLSPARLSLTNKPAAGAPAVGLVLSLYRSPARGERSTIPNEVLLSASEARSLGQLLVEAVADQVEASPGETGPAAPGPGPAPKPKAPTRREVELREAEARRSVLNRQRFEADWAQGAPGLRRAPRIG